MKNANPGQQRKSVLSDDDTESRWGLTPPLRRSNLVPQPGVVCTITFIIASPKDSKSSDGMIYLGTDGNTESQKQRVDDTYHQPIIQTNQSMTYYNQS
jgi:hypothetical protein